MKIPFSPPYIDGSVIQEVTDTLNSGWITTGPKVKALEEEIQKLVETECVVCVNSWTSGAIMALRWLGLNADDEVIVPVYTYCATALAVLWAGGKPVMVDSGADFNISVEAVRKAITSKTKAIIPVDFAGYPCDYSALMNLVDEPQIKDLYKPESEVQEKIGRIMVISDEAHSLGANYNGARRPDIIIYSLHAVKNITTAEGGAVCLNLPKPFNNNQLYADFRLLTLNCQTKDAFSKSTAGGWRYDIVGQGMKINMADINAAIGLAQIRQYDKLLTERRRIFESYIRAFSKYDWAVLPPVKTDGRETSYHIFALRIKGITEQQRDKIIEEVAKKEVVVNVHFIPLPLLSFFKNMGFDINNYPQAYNSYCSEISLPVYPQLDDEKVNFVIKSVVEAYKTVVGE